MKSKSLLIVGLKPDLRSAKGNRIQRGLAIRLLRILSLVLFDAIAIGLAWKLAIACGTPFESPWTQKSSFLLLTISVEISIFIASGLYKAGFNRRNYERIIKTISLSETLLLLIAFLYAPKYISRSTFLLSWLLSIAFVCTFRFLFDATINLLRTKGSVRHSVFIISDSEEEKNHIRLIEQQNSYTVLGVTDSSSLDLDKRNHTFAYLRECSWRNESRWSTSVSFARCGTI